MSKKEKEDTQWLIGPANVEHLHIVGLSDLWLAWIKPNKLAARAVTEVLQTYLTPDKVVGAVKEALAALSGSQQDQYAVRGLASQVLKWLDEGRYQEIGRLCKLVLAKDAKEQTHVENPRAPKR